MSGARKTSAEYLQDHIRELNDINDEGSNGKKMIGLVTMVMYDDGRCYPHASGVVDHARAIGLLQTYLLSITLGEHQRWCERAISRGVLEEGL
jgi:hypothetical protein